MHTSMTSNKITLMDGMKIYIPYEGGNILDYNQCKLEVLYTKPLYTAKQQKYILYAAQRYLMYSNDDYEKVTHQLQLMKWKIAVVRQFLKLNVKIQCINSV